MTNERTITDLAYALWEARGSPHGSAEVDWTEAERQVLASRKGQARAPDAQDESLEETFPASDPPASKLPDRPPSNADSQWARANSERDDTESGAAKAK